MTKERWQKEEARRKITDPRYFPPYPFELERKTVDSSKKDLPTSKLYDGRFVGEGYGAPEAAIKPKKDCAVQEPSLEGLSAIEIGLMFSR